MAPPAREALQALAAALKSAAVPWSDEVVDDDGPGQGERARELLATAGKGVVVAALWVPSLSAEAVAAAVSRGRGGQQWAR